MSKNFATQKSLGIYASRKDARPGKQFVRVSVGQIVNVAPHCDLWMQGAKTAELRVIRTYTDRVVLRVRPIIGELPLRRLCSIESHHILA